MNFYSLFSNSSHNNKLGGGGQFMRPLLFIPLAFLTDLRAEESSWYAGGSFLIGQGEQKRTITTLEPPQQKPTPPKVVESPPSQPRVLPQTKPLPEDKPQVQDPPPQHKSAQSSSPQENPAEAPLPPQAQKQDPPQSKSKRPQGRAEQPQDDPQQQAQDLAKKDYENKVSGYWTQRADALEHASTEYPTEWGQFQSFCDRKKGLDKRHNCLNVAGPNAKVYLTKYRSLFNEIKTPNADFPTCPTAYHVAIPQGYTQQQLEDYNCYYNGIYDNGSTRYKGPIIPPELPQDVPNMFASLYRLLTLQTNRYTQTNLSNLVSVSKQTTLHYGVSLAIGYKHFFVPRFGLRTYANIEYLYTNAYFSNSNILYGGGLDFLANIIDNNDKQSMIFGIFAGVNLAGNTSIAQIKDNHVSNTQFNTFLHTGLRFVFNGMHEFDLGVKVPFLKNPSVSLNTSNKLYEVQNNTLYSMFISYYYLF
ncbi:outer membrane beta-barrel protein [Helicobacter cetorum]|uniref:Outer membrane protein HopK n=1 Tax=Helicobacter cetorum (strain ATCC BAA-540 / CCUG 52418 / MIT 99-5656) TaxID=1163745 RepID=I0ETN6_HELCM|nr:outer membrane beta-barrel protein [Helicobacter cetorum]AFI06305.1 outer membrane protein HopK [Helicobacter cetorum MIT 99-5656]